MFLSLSFPFVLVTGTTNKFGTKVWYGQSYCEIKNQPFSAYQTLYELPIIFHFPRFLDSHKSQSFQCCIHIENARRGIT